MTGTMTGSRKRSRGTVGGLVAAVLLTATVSLAGPLQQGAQAATSDPTACERAWDALPAAMQDDLRAALDLRPRAQHRAMLAIRRAALHGGYGEQVQTWARTLQHRRAELWKSFPEQLKADVRAAVSLPFREQRRAMNAVRYAALHGAYGDEVQHLAEKRQAFLAGCPDDVRTYIDSASDPLAA
jgi:hypothetical protein